MVPSFGYPGGKHYLRKWHSKFMPLSCRTYCEPCAGRGNVFWLAAGVVDAQAWRLNDIATAPFFRTLLTLSDREIDYVIGSKYPAEAEYRQFCRDATSSRAILFEPFLTFSGGGYGNGYVPEQPKASTVVGYKARLKEASRLLRANSVTVTACDWREACRDLTSEDFVYFDPPYMRADVRAYSAKFDHAGMIQTLANAPFRWLLAEYVEPEYIAAFGKPLDTQEYRLKVSGTGESRNRVVTEAIWGNLGW